MASIKILIPILLAASLLGQYSPPAGGGGGGGGTGVTGPLGFGYTFYLTSGTYYARNNATHAVDYSGSDAGVVIRSAIAHNAAVCGHLYFTSAVYNINSLVQENTGGYSHYYGIGFPHSAATGFKCQWTVEGDSTLVPLDQFAAPAQTNGAIFYVTPTAVATVSSTTEIMAFWTRPDATYIVGPVLSFKNIGVRFPDNQRGSETAINSTQAASVDYESVMADFATAENDLQFPVAGSHGLYGITTTDSVHEQNYMRNTYAFGYDHCLDIQSEHSVLINSYGARCNYAIDYGVRGTGGVSHASSWMSSGWGECAHGLTLGSMMQAGSMLDISGLDIEDATTGTWVPVAHASEAHPGYTFGRISYSRVYQAVGLSPLAFLFDGGGGGSFELKTSSPTGTYVSFDTFVGTAGTLLSAHTSNTGGTWTLYNPISGDPSNTIKLNGAGGIVATDTTGTAYSDYIYSFVPGSADYTVAANITFVGGAAGTFKLAGRMDNAVFTGYISTYSVGVGLKLFRCVSASCAQVGSTFSLSWPSGSSHSISITFAGGVITCHADGVQWISYTDSSPIAGPGQAMISVQTIAPTVMTMTNFGIQ